MFVGPAAVAHGADIDETDFGFVMAVGKRGSRSSAIAAAAVASNVLLSIQILPKVDEHLYVLRMRHGKHVRGRLERQVTPCPDRTT